jgi:hypothetical protein
MPDVALGASAGYQECWSNPGFVSVFFPGLTLKSTKLFQEVRIFFWKFAIFLKRLSLFVTVQWY